MRILAVTDIHGRYAAVTKIAERETPDILIVGGDLTTIGTVHEAEEAIRTFRSVCPMLLCVAGNMDTHEHDALFERLDVSINGRGVIIDGVGFFGVSAAPISPLHTPNEVTEEEIARRAALGCHQTKDARLKVFVPHAPPYGTRVDIIHAGIHVGSTAVRDFIEQENPDIVVCGHIHEARGQDMIGTTRIVNCGAASNGCYCLIEIDELGAIIIENRRQTG